MMILDNVSLPSAGNTAQDKPVRTSSGGSASSVPIATNNGAAETETTNAVTASSGTQTLNAINSNTYVVKLEPQPENGTTNRAPKTNLLQLFSENGKGKNLSIVRALGIGRIVVNRTSLKNGKEKPSQPPAPFSANKLNIGLSRTPIFVRTAPQISHVSRRDDKNMSSDKKDDDISGNLANFMNFKLTGLVPSPLMKSEIGKNTFEINMKPPDVRLPKQDDKQVTGKPDTTLSLSPLKTRPKSPEPQDDDLTSLSWLTSNDTNLLKTIRSWNPDDAGISLSGDDTDEEDDDDVASNKSNAVFTAKSKVECGSQGGFAARQYGQPYSPNGKPPYSFSCLIFMAVEDSQEKMLPVKEIYAWVCKHFPYFETAPSGWKNSIRHNLSLNKCFKKADQGRNAHDPGKGSLWCIDPAYRPNLIQALKRTPFYPYLYPSGIGQPLSLNNLASLLPGVKAGRVPLWSPSMTQSTSSWTDPDVASAALNLMGLRGNEAADRSANVRSTLQELAAEIFNQNDDVAGTIPLVITDPADDHTYSISFAKSKNEIDGERCLSPNSDKSAPDAAYEFETPGTDLESDVEVEEGLSVDGSDTECELADSGFAGLKGRERNRNKGKRKKSSRSLSLVALKSKRTRSSSKPTQSSSKKGLKVRFQHKKKTKTTSPGAKKLKRKITPQEGDDGLTSDADSGKDSPKVQSKSRRRTPAKIKPAPPPAKKAKKTTHFKPAYTSPYGTRSTKQTRHSKRIGAFEHGNILERASARRRKQDSVSADTDDEEIKLAAGSLLHLAGFRSPP